MNDFKQYRGRGRGTYQHNNNYRGPIFNNVRRGSPNTFAPLLPLTHYRDNRFRWQRPQHTNMWRSTPPRMPYMHPRMPPPLIQKPPVETRPMSPLPGSEEARQKVIAEASARIKEQLNLTENDGLNTTRHVQSPILNNDNFNNECFVAEQFPKIVHDKQSEKTPKKKIKKPTSFSSETNTNTNIEELRNKILTQFTYMSKGKIQNLVNNPGSSRYDGALQHLVRDMRLHLSSELRNMYYNRETDSKENNEMIDHFNSIVPDLGVELVSLPDTMVAELSKILQFDVNNDLQEENDNALVEPEDMFKQAEKLLSNTEFLDDSFENSNLQSNEESQNPFLPDSTTDSLVSPLSMPFNQANNDPFICRSPVFNEPPPNPIISGDVLEPTDMDIDDIDENVTTCQEENLAAIDPSSNLNTIPLPNSNLQQPESEEINSSPPQMNNTYNILSGGSSPFSKKILEANLQDGASVSDLDYCTTSIPNSNPFVDTTGKYPVSDPRTETHNKNEKVTDPELFNLESVWISKTDLFKKQIPPKIDNSVTNITSFLNDVISNNLCDKTILQKECLRDKNSSKIEKQHLSETKEIATETSANRLSLDERIKMMMMMQETNVRKSEQTKTQETVQRKLTKNQKKRIRNNKSKKLKMEMKNNLKQFNNNSVVNNQQSQQLSSRNDVLDGVVIKQENLDMDEIELDRNKKNYNVCGADPKKNNVPVQKSVLPDIWIKTEKEVNSEIKRNAPPTKAALKEISKESIPQNLEEHLQNTDSNRNIKKNSTSNNFPKFNIQSISALNNTNKVTSLPVKNLAPKNISEKSTENITSVSREISDNSLQNISLKCKESNNVVTKENSKAITEIIPEISNNSISDVTLKTTSETCNKNIKNSESDLNKNEVLNTDSNIMPEKSKQKKIKLIRIRKEYLNPNENSKTETNEERKNSLNVETLQTSQHNEVSNSIVKNKDENIETEKSSQNKETNDSTINIQHTNSKSETETEITKDTCRETEKVSENTEEIISNDLAKSTEDCKKKNDDNISKENSNLNNETNKTKDENIYKEKDKIYNPDQQRDKDSERTLTDLQSDSIVPNVLTNNKSEETKDNQLNITENNEKELNVITDIIPENAVEKHKVDLPEINLIAENEASKEIICNDIPETPKEETNNKPEEILKNNPIQIINTVKDNEQGKDDKNKDTTKKVNKIVDKDNVEKLKENKTKSSHKSKSKERENAEVKKHSKMDETIKKEVNTSKTCHSSKSDSTKHSKDRERSRSKSKSKTKHHSDHSKKSHSSSHQSKRDIHVLNASTQTESYTQQNNLPDFQSLNKICMDEENIVSRLMTIDMQIQNLMQEKWELYKQLNLKKNESAPLETKSVQSKEKNEVSENSRIRPLSTTPSESSCFSDLGLNFKKQREIRSVSLTHSECSANDLVEKQAEKDRDSKIVMNKRKRVNKKPEPKNEITKTENKDSDLNNEISKTSRKRPRTRQIEKEKSADDTLDSETPLRKKGRIEKKVEPKKATKTKNTKTENKLDSLVNTSESAKDHTVIKKTNELEEPNEKLNISKENTEKKIIDINEDKLKIETLSKDKKIEEKLNTENLNNAKQSTKKQKKRESNKLVTDIMEEPNKKYYVKIKKPDKKMKHLPTDNETIDIDINQEINTKKNKSKSNKVTNQDNIIKTNDKDKKLENKTKIILQNNENLNDDISHNNLTTNLEGINVLNKDNLLEIHNKETDVEKSDEKLEDTLQTNTEMSNEFECNDKETDLKTSKESLNNNTEINSAIIKKSKNYNLKDVKVCLTEYSNELNNKSKIKDSPTENKNTDLNESTNISSESKINKKKAKRSQKSKKDNEQSHLKSEESLEISEIDEQKLQCKISKTEEEKISSRESSLDIPSDSKMVSLQTLKQQKRSKKDRDEDIRSSRSRSTSKESDFKRMNKCNRILDCSEDEIDNQPLQVVKKKLIYSESEASDSSHIDEKLRIEKKINSKRKRNLSNDANLSETEAVNKNVPDNSVVKSCVIKLERIDLNKKYKYDPNTLKYTPKDFIYTSTLITSEEMQNSLFNTETKSDDICESISHSNFSTNSENQSQINQLEDDVCPVDNSEKEQTNEDRAIVENAEIIEHKDTSEIVKITEIEESAEVNSESNNIDENGLFCMGHQKSILDIKIIGDEFLAASEDGTVYKYCLKTGSLQDAYTGHKRAVTCMFVMHGTIIDVDATIMYSGSLDCTLKCYNIETAEILHSVTVEQAIQCMDSAWGHIFLGTYDGLLFIYNIKKKLLNDISLTIANATVLMIKATQEGSRQVLILASRKKEIMVRDAFTGLLLRTMCQDQKPTIYSLLLDRSLVYCGTSDKGILILNFNNGNQVGLFNSGKGVVCMVIYKCLLFAGCYDGMIYVYNTKRQEYVTTLPGPGEGMLLSLAINEDMIIAGTKKNHLLKIWKIPQEILHQSD